MVADVVVSAAKSFPDPTTLALVSDVQFREPYSSGALNRKFRGIVNPGIYGGFTPSPAGGLTLQITSDSEGGTASINIDKYYQLTVRQQAGVSLSLTAGKTSIVVLEATYVVGQETYQVNANSAIQAAEIKLLEEGALLNENQLELCTVKIPAGATEITDDMIDVTNRKLVTLGISLSNDYESDAEDVAITPKGVKEGLAKKQPLDTTLSELSGKTVAELLEYLRLGEGAPMIGVPFAWPSEKMPSGVFPNMANMTFLKSNGALFDVKEFPILAMLYPDGKLDDLRGEFIRGWDDGRGVDSARALRSLQGYAFEDHAHSIPTNQGYAGVEKGSTENDIFAAFSDNMRFVGSILSNGQWADYSQPKIYLRSDGLAVGNNNGMASEAEAKYSSIRTYRASTGWNNPLGNFPKTAKETRPRNVALCYIVRAA